MCSLLDNLYKLYKIILRKSNVIAVCFFLINIFYDFTNLINLIQLDSRKEITNKVEKIFYDKKTSRVYINKEQYFEGIPEEVWEYQIGAYQVMEKYLKDRKGRKLSLEEINNYMKVEKALRLTIELQKKIDKVYTSVAST